MSSSATRRCCQVALSTMNLTKSLEWYQHALGFLPAGERRHREGSTFAAVAGLPEAAFDVACVVGGQPMLQIEMFEFARPIMRRLPAGWRRCDLGYSAIGVHCPDFDRALSRCLLPGTSPLPPSMGALGARRACVQDPDGILVELFEDHSLDDRASATNGLPSIVSVTVSVQDLAAAYDFWVGALGFSAVADAVLHDPEHEALWRLDGAASDSMLLNAGSFVIELVEYRGSRGRRRPAGYLISDQGLLNVAVGFDDKHEFECSYNRAVERGFRGYTEPWTVPGVATVVYLSDAEGLTVELLHVERSAFQYMGFIANQPSFASTRTRVRSARPRRTNTSTAGQR